MPVNDPPANDGHDTSSSPPRSRPSALPFLAWAVVGACASVGLLGALTIGPFVLLLAMAGAGLLAWRRGVGIACWGLLAGAGLPPLYVAYLNRAGPGDICVATSTGQTCVAEWNPWPWLAAGLALAAAGTSLFLILRRRAGS